jgi:hypothetical protein
MPSSTTLGNDCGPLPPTGCVGSTAARGSSSANAEPSGPEFTPSDTAQFS